MEGHTHSVIASAEEVIIEETDHDLGLSLDGWGGFILGEGSSKGAATEVWSWRNEGRSLGHLGARGVEPRGECGGMDGLRSSSLHTALDHWDQEYVSDPQIIWGHRRLGFFLLFFVCFFNFSFLE